MTADVGTALGEFTGVSKVFFAFDMQSYARLTTVYLAEMFSLRDRSLHVELF